MKGDRYALPNHLSGRPALDARHRQSGTDVDLGLKATDAGPPIIELAWGYGVDHGKVRFAKATNKLGFKGVMLHSGTCRIYARPPTDFHGRPFDKAELPTEVLNVARDKRVVAVSILPRQFFDAPTVDVPMVTAL